MAAASHCCGSRLLDGRRRRSQAGNDTDAAQKGGCPSVCGVIQSGDLDALRTLFASDAVIQGVLKKGQMDEILPIWQALHEGLAAHLTIDDMIAEGDVVAVRYTERGTFRGPFLGHQPTGKSYQLVAMEWLVVRDGKIQQCWGARDAASQAEQIGLSLKL